MKIAAAKDMKVIKENMISYVDDHGDLREATEHVYKIEVALTMSDGSEHKAHSPLLASLLPLAPLPS